MNNNMPKRGKLFIKSIHKINDSIKKIIYSNNNEYTGETGNENIKHGKGKIIFYDFKCFWVILLVKNVLHSIIRKNFASKKL